MLNRILFESPTWWLVIWGLTMLVLLIGWARGSAKAWTRALLVAIVLLPAVLLLQSAVTTQREQIIAGCNVLAEAVEAGDLPAIRARLAADLDAEGLTRDDLLRKVESVLTRYHVSDARLSDFAVEFPQPDQARVRFRAACTPTTEQDFLQRLLTVWDLTWRRTSTGWEVTRIAVVESPLSPIKSLRQVR